MQRIPVTWDALQDRLFSWISFGTASQRKALCAWVVFWVCGAAFAGGKFVNLGPQVDGIAIQGSEFMRDAQGRDLVYTVERGQPGHLLGYEVSTGKKVLNVPLGEADGAWEVTASSDGFLYTCSGIGHMYRYRPGARGAQDLGVVLRQRVIWDVTPGPGASVFAGTYPDCLVVQYEPGKGFADVGQGPMVAGENYVRSLVYDPANGKIYVGVGSHAHLIELDPKTGEKKELLKEQTRGQEAVYSLQLIPDQKSGDRLLVWITNRDHTLVYNLRTQKVEREFASGDVKAVKKSPVTEDVYYSNGINLMSINLDRPGEAPRELVHCSTANASQWVDATHLCLLVRPGDLVNYDVQTGEAREKKLSVPAQAIPIQSIALGPDGKMWMGGYLAGGTASYDPVTGKTAHYRGMSQIERIGTLNGIMYFGIYPHGRFYRFDPAKPWGDDNPKKITQIPEQSRPVAVLGVPELNKVFVGTVPEYGFLGGHLISYDAGSGRIHDEGQVVARQSVVSLAYSHGILIGGTSVYGGLGIKPSEKTAKIFGWDEKGSRKIFEMAPVPGAYAITCLINGPDGNVWGVADGDLFIFDPGTQNVVNRKHLFETHFGSRAVWRDAFLEVNPDGEIYGVVDGRFFRLDPRTLRAEVLRRGDVEVMAMDREGRLYFHEGINLWRYAP